VADGGRRPATDRRFDLSFIAGLGRDALDPGYAEAAERRRHGHSSRSVKHVTVAWVVLAMVLAGVAVGVAVRSNQINAPSAARARAGVLADVARAQQRAGELEATASSLAEQIRDRQQALGAGGALQSVADLEALTAMTAVQGPGLRVVINRAATGNIILDRDVQLLVNGLWAAGAEAISVGGLRLRATSAIRTAGGTILVDNKPTFWPITIEAIGPENKMHVAFSETSGFARFAGFAANYGATFKVVDAASLTLPAAPPLDWQYAQPGTADATGTTTGATAGSVPGTGTGTVAAPRTTG
jgi:uncharacterized protein YlxW (UPF0749 family)